MADENKTQTQQTAEVSDKQAFKDGKLQPGYQYRYVTRRRADGTAETVRIVEKRG